jgi:hypothetical protein
MHPYKIALSASAALLASTSLSSAVSVSQTVSFSSLTDWGTNPQTPNFAPTKVISFTGFNPSLGTLNSVQVTITDKVLGGLNLKNNGTTGTTNVTGSLLNSLKYGYPTHFGQTDTLQSTTYSATLAAQASSGLHTVTGSNTQSHTVHTSLATFETGWAVTAGDLGQLVIGSGNGNGVATYTDTGAITIVADYSYTAPPPPPPPPSPTPEPATLALLGSGLAGLGVLRRRRKSS